MAKETNEPNFKENGLTKLAKTVVMIFNILLFIMGLGCIGVGLWMAADPYVKSYFIVLRRNYNDLVLSAAPAILIVCGIFCIAMACVGFIGITRRNRKLLLLYSIVVLIILLMELVVGFLCVVFRDQIHMYLKDGMKESIQNEYTFDNTVGRAWNFVQVRHKCCGADGSWDYQESAWFHNANADASDDLTDPTIFVPKTCCVLEFNQDRDPARVDPQDPRPKDEKRCQEDAEGNIVNGEYVHKRGCFARLNDFIHHHINTLVCIGLIVGFLQLVGFLSSAYLTCSFDNNDEDLVKQQQRFLQQQKHQERA